MSSAHGVGERTITSLFFSIVASTCMLLVAPSALAVNANPNNFSEIQPDGTPISLRVRGDEHFNWAEDLDGYTVIRTRGWYEYARLDAQGRLAPTGIKVGLNDPEAFGLSRGILPCGRHQEPGGPDPVQQPRRTCRAILFRHRCAIQRPGR